MQIDKNYLNKDRKYYGHTRNELLPYIPNNLTTILDVGCSNGDFGLLMKKKFNVKEVWGIEPFSSAADIAKLKLDSVICENIESALTDLPSNFFDCIFFNDVLEHLVNPDTVLDDIKPLLSEKGYVFASIPNILHFDTMYSIVRNLDWKYEDAGILDKTHLRFFTKKSIVRMFNNAGYDVISIDGINPSFSNRFKVINKLLSSKIDEMKFIQFAVLAKVSVK